MAIESVPRSGSFFVDVCGWCQNNSHEVRACYLVSRNRLTLFFIPFLNHYDFDLGEHLVDLSLMLGDYDIGKMVEILQVPWEERERFFRPDMAITIFEH